LLTRPLAGVLADRWGRKPVLVLGAVLLCGGPPLYAFVSSVPWLLGVRAVHGVGLALFSTAYPALIADLLPPGRYGEGLGLANAATNYRVMYATTGGTTLLGLVVGRLVVGRRKITDKGLERRGC